MNFKKKEEQVRQHEEKSLQQQNATNEMYFTEFGASELNWNVGHIPTS